MYPMFQVSCLWRMEKKINVLTETEITESSGADVKIMDRLFWHREVPRSENFSKPGFQLKTARFLGVFVGGTGLSPDVQRKRVI